MISNLKLEKAIRRAIFDQLIKKIRSELIKEDQIYEKNGNKWTPDNTEKNKRSDIELESKLNFFSEKVLSKYERNTLEAKYRISQLKYVRRAIQRLYPDDKEFYDIFFPDVISRENSLETSPETSLSKFSGTSPETFSDTSPDISPSTSPGTSSGTFLSTFSSKFSNTFPEA